MSLHPSFHTQKSLKYCTNLCVCVQGDVGGLRHYGKRAHVRRHKAKSSSSSDSSDSDRGKGSGKKGKSVSTLTSLSVYSVSVRKKKTWVMNLYMTREIPLLLQTLKTDIAGGCTVFSLYVLYKTDSLSLRSS